MFIVNLSCALHLVLELGYQIDPFHFQMVSVFLLNLQFCQLLFFVSFSLTPFSIHSYSTPLVVFPPPFSTSTSHSFLLPLPFSYLVWLSAIQLLLAGLPSLLHVFKHLMLPILILEETYPVTATPSHIGFPVGDFLIGPGSRPPRHLYFGMLPQNLYFEFLLLGPRKGREGQRAMFNPRHGPESWARWTCQSQGQTLGKGRR